MTSRKTRLDRVEVETRAWRDKQLAAIENALRLWEIPAAEYEALLHEEYVGGWGKYPNIVAALERLRAACPLAIPLGRRMIWSERTYKNLTNNEIKAVIAARADYILGNLSAILLAIRANEGDPDAANLVRAMTEAERKAAESLWHDRPTTQTWETVEGVEARLPELVKAAWEKTKDLNPSTEAKTTKEAMPDSAKPATAEQ